MASLLHSTTNARLGPVGSGALRHSTNIISTAWVSCLSWLCSSPQRLLPPRCTFDPTQLSTDNLSFIKKQIGQVWSVTLKPPLWEANSLGDCLSKHECRRHRGLKPPPTRLFPSGRGYTAASSPGGAGQSGDCLGVEQKVIGRHKKQAETTRAARFGGCPCVSKGRVSLGISAYLPCVAW